MQHRKRGRILMLGVRDDDGVGPLLNHNRLTHQQCYCRGDKNDCLDNEFIILSQ